MAWLAWPAAQVGAHVVSASYGSYSWSSLAFDAIEALGEWGCHLTAWHWMAPFCGLMLAMGCGVLPA